MKYRCLTPERREDMLRDISGNVPLLFETGQHTVIRQLNKEDLNSRFYSSLSGYISVLQIRNDLCTMIALVQVLDEALKSLLLEQIRACQTDDFSVVLNSNRETTGIGLLPRCSCVWERRNRLSHSYNRLDNFMIHFLLIENSILGELIDKHIFLPDNFFPDFSARR